MSKISIIVATDEHRGIGKANNLMWHIPEELKVFKEKTMGHPMVMGRKTYESIGRPLPGRTSIVITREPHKMEPQEGLRVVSSLDEALESAKDLPGNEEIFIIGGGQIYTQALNLADKLYLTLVQGDFKADVFFPEYEGLFKKVSESEWLTSGEQKYKFQVFEKV